VVDAKTMAVTAKYDLGSATLTPAGLAFDVRNHILFAACRNPASMVILNADNGKILPLSRLVPVLMARFSIPTPWRPSVRKEMAR
jgi:hypothetical protein